MNARIAAVVITRNGEKMLPGLLESLIGQSAPLEEIIVVDNASTDRTLEWLTREYPSVTVIPLKSNEGVSGGYAAGLEHALLRDYDWVWMLDEDSRPSRTTLTELVAVQSELSERERLAIIAPLPVNAATGEPYPLFLWKKRQVKLPAPRKNEAFTLVDMVISSGSLIRAEAVRKAGLPRRDFFMDFVDYEHCLRLRECGFLIGVANRCRMPHSIGSPRTVSLFGWRMLRSTHEPWREYYKVRNRAFVVWHQVPGFSGKLFVVYKLVTQIVGTLFFDSERFKRIQHMCRGMRDGIRGKLGSAVLPGD